MSRKTTVTTMKKQAPCAVGHLKLTTSDYGDYYTGTVDTYHGIVSVYSQGYGSSKKDDQHTALNIIVGGVDCFRTFDACYGKKHLVTLARRFAEEMHQETETEKDKEATDRG